MTHSLRLSVRSALVGTVALAAALTMTVGLGATIAGASPFCPPSTHNCNVVYNPAPPTIVASPSNGSLMVSGFNFTPGGAVTVWVALVTDQGTWQHRVIASADSGRRGVGSLYVGSITGGSVSTNFAYNSDSGIVGHCGEPVTVTARDEATQVWSNQIISLAPCSPIY